MRNANRYYQIVRISELPFFAEPGEASPFLLPFRLAERLIKEARQKAREEFQKETQQEAERMKREVDESGHRPKKIQEDRPRVRRKRSASHEVQVFDVPQLDKVWESTWSRQAQDRRSRAEAWFKAAKENRGMRTVPSLRPADLNKRCQKLCTRFPHFRTAISHLKAELMLSMSSRPSDFRVSPILLHGTPGIGKTLFASGLAEMLNVPSEVISAGSAQGNFDICGTSTHWDNAEAGKVFRLLANNGSAVSVLVIDEIDKIGSEGRYPIVPALLDLLEGQTAKQFRDEAVGVRVDASKIIIIATANELQPISSALLSRLHAIEIPEPTVEERLHLLMGMLSGIQKVTKAKIAISDEALARIAMAPGDLREMQRILRMSIGHALASKKVEIGLADLCFSNAKVAHPIGFIQ